MPTLNITKFANAFVPNAVPSAFVGGAARQAVDRFGKKHGGLWVGGKITASPAGLHFEPNRMNLALHAGLQGTSIPMSSIRRVAREFGWLTGIVVVHSAEGEFRFRCFGAKQVAASMDAYVKSL